MEDLFKENSQSILIYMSTETQIDPFSKEVENTTLNSLPINAIVTDSHASLSNVNSRAVIVWQDYDGSNYDISYRTYNGSSWDAQVDITSDATEDRRPTALDNDTDALHVVWDRGASTPWDIYFDYVKLTSESNAIFFGTNF